MFDIVNSSTLSTLSTVQDERNIDIDIDIVNIVNIDIVNIVNIDIVNSSTWAKHLACILPRVCWDLQIETKFKDLEIISSRLKQQRHTV